jgi:hypothetical protein
MQFQAIQLDGAEKTQSCPSVVELDTAIPDATSSMPEW